MVDVRGRKSSLNTSYWADYAKYIHEIRSISTKIKQCFQHPQMGKALLIIFNGKEICS